VPEIAIWKLLVPAVGAVMVGALIAHPGDFADLRQSATAHRSATLGYLTPQELPDGVALLPPPPQAGSAAMLGDEEARAAALPLKGTARYALAAADADRQQASTATAFQCAFGAEISAERTPALFELLAKVRLDVRAASYPAKSHFKRPRPFAVYNTHTCYPADESNVRDDGSYPSARGAVGWAYAEVLKELNPARAAEIWQRAIEFGHSRVVCDEEWLSDVEASRILGVATLKHIEDKPAFRSDFNAARREVAAALRSGAKPPNCKAETLALASR
jgi:acid phosphatase (class A)